VPGPGGLDDHRVPALQRVQVQEGAALPDPVAGDGEVADLPGQRGAGVVAGAGLQLLGLDPLDDGAVPVLAEARRVQEGERRAGRRRHGRAGGRPVLAELVAHPVLRPVAGDTGAPHLVGDDQQDHRTGEDGQRRQRADQSADHGSSSRSGRPARRVPAGGTAGPQDVRAPVRRRVATRPAPPPSSTSPPATARPSTSAPVFGSGVSPHGRRRGDDDLVRGGGLVAGVVDDGQRDRVAAGRGVGVLDVDALGGGAVTESPSGG
jgi:hypothetical protein